MGNQPYIVGVGAANLDLNGASCAPIHLRDSNPGHISLSAGGVTRNVCENLARLGADVKLLSCVGDDVFGSYICRSCVEAGIDISHLHEARGAHSSIYLSILDADGDMLVGMSDMRIVQQDLPADYLPSQKQLIQGAKVVTCDPCMGETALLQLLDLCQPPQIVCVDPQRAGEVVLNKGLKRLFVSLGAEGCFYMDDTGAVLRRKLRPAKMVNASGAGDSFAAAMLYATLQGYDAEKTLDYGMAAGIAAVTHERTINPNMSVPLLESILQTYRL